MEIRTPIIGGLWTNSPGKAIVFAYSFLIFIRINDLHDAIYAENEKKAGIGGPKHYFSGARRQFYLLEACLDTGKKHLDQKRLELPVNIIQKIWLVFYALEVTKNFRRSPQLHRTGMTTWQGKPRLNKLAARSGKVTT
ncbi:hypothetical protein ACL9RI_03700 [Janthinobacterium sp. Mn2066]|uniref:hypothetical protein n=1 Tax=Janthinobacterium sp. Mn2066 TaxID=3395264 RepID=UPI003BE76F9F